MLSVSPSRPKSLLTVAIDRETGDRRKQSGGMTEVTQMLDGLIDDPKLPDRLSEDEREYRGSQLTVGVLTMYVVGIVLLLAALGLYIWGV